MKTKSGVVLVAVLVMCAIPLFSLGYSNPIEGGSIETVSNDSWWLPIVLTVGKYTPENGLIITNGGVVVSRQIHLGAYLGANKNFIHVVGDGSRHYDSDLVVVGQYGSENTLLVADGGSVENRHGYIGAFGGSDSNAVVVNGRNSVWKNNASILVGNGGAENRLYINYGGRVESPVVNVGVQSISSNNTVTVTGNGSMLDAPEIYIGGSSAGAGGIANRIEVENGGAVATTDLNIYAGNRFDLNNGGTLAVSTNFNAAMSGFNFNSGGTLEVGGELTGMDTKIEGRRSVVLNGTNAHWTSSFRVYVGHYTSGNSVVATNGGRVEASGMIGGYNGSSDNHVTVSGEGTEWISKNGFSVGNGDGTTGNTLTILDGGKVETLRDGTTIGFYGGSTGNTVAVSGAGSLLNHKSLTGGILLGWGGSDNSLVVADGGRVESSRDIWMGGTSEALANAILIDGSGSVVRAQTGVYVGFRGSNNRIVISDAGKLENGFSNIGHTSGADSNSVLVTGMNSIWQNNEALYLGGRKSGVNWIDGGTGNSLTVSNGGWVLVGDVDTNNVPTLGNGGVLAVGDASGNPEMILANGSSVANAHGFIGLGAGESGRVDAYGEGTVWNNSSYLHVGYEGSGNTLHIEDGARVHAGWNSTIGYADGANGNSVVVSGAESSLSTGWGLSVSRPVISVPPISIWPQPTNQVPIIGYPPIDFPPYITPFPTNQWPPFIVYTIPTNFVPIDPVNGSVWTSGSLTVGSISNNVLIPITNYPPPLPVYAIRVEASIGELVVGRGGSDNTLDILDGATVSSFQGIIGETSNAWNNDVSVVGSNSAWRTSRDFYLGGRMSQYSYMTSNGWENSWADGGRGNSLYVADGGLVSVGRDMHNRNYSTVSVDPGGHISVSSNYYQDATSVLRFGVETNAAGAPLNPFVSVGGTAEFEEGATLQYHSNVGVLDFDTFHTNLIVEADQLIIAGVTNANALDLTALNLDGSLVDLLLWEQNQNIYGLVGRKYLADSAGFTPGSQMAGVSRGIDDLSLLGNPGAVAQINLLNGMSSAQQNAQLTQRYTQGTPTHRHQQSMQGGQKQVLAQSRSFQSTNRSQGATPEGAAGPHKAEQGLRGWMRGYGSWANHDGTDSFSGFDQTVYGTIVGLDKVFGNVLLGAAGGYSRSDLTQDNLDSSDAKTGFGVLYSSFGSIDWFGDLNLSYGRSGIKTRSGTALGGEGDFDADNYAIYLGGGKVIQSADGDGVLLTPEAALLLGYYDQEGYNDGLMEVDAYDRWSVQSRLGATLAFEKQTGSVLLKPEVRAYWLHEFNADPDQIGYSIGGGGRYTFGVQAPDEDILEIGAGFSATFNGRLEIVLDIDAQHCELYQATIVGVRAMYEF